MQVHMQLLLPISMHPDLLLHLHMCPLLRLLELDLFARLLVHPRGLKIPNSILMARFDGVCLLSQKNQPAYK
jgi:hypothetical protein